MKRCGTIELLRFIAAISIAIYHFEYICMGAPVYFQHNYIWVEFYFILSGFFLAKNASLGGNVCSWGYALNQFKKLYPLYFLAFVVSFLGINMLNQISVKEMLHNLWFAKWELLLCYVFGFDYTVAYNGGGAPAYIPVLIICSVALYYLIEKHRDLFINVIMPVFVLGGLGYVLNLHGHLSVWQQRGQFVPLGLVRGFAEMSFGAFCWLILLPYAKQIAGYFKGIILLVCLVACSFLCVFRMYISGTDLLLWVFIYGMLIVVASTITLPDKINKICCCLGGLNYPIFLFHYVVFQVMNTYLDSNINYYLQLIISFVILFIVVLFIQFGRNVYKKLKYRLLQGLKNC